MASHTHHVSRFSQNRCSVLETIAGLLDLMQIAGNFDAQPGFMPQNRRVTYRSVCDESYLGADEMRRIDAALRIVLIYRFLTC
jgi:hypothetical protein